MYESHWKLSRRPFENRGDSQFYYPAETHQAALLKLHYAIENRRAAALLCGPGGMGKSLLISALQRQLSDTYRPIHHLVFPAMNSVQLVRYLVDQLGAVGKLDGGELGGEKRGEASRDMASDIMAFERFLRENLENERHAVIVIDEAHLLEQYDLLEPLRLLLNLAANESEGEAAWTLVLVGQPTLLSHVERYHALDERLGVKCMLNRLLPEETTAYIQHRLRNVGADAEEIFDCAALEKIHALTQGIPRRINRLCDLALMVGYAEDRTMVTADVIDNVHGDLAAPSIM
ncbi:MAG: AAA family ATPase [Planctomycetales bacterium]|nr:AAA family ATPase [Planctomycetales bacterium]